VKCSVGKGCKQGVMGGKVARSEGLGVKSVCAIWRGGTLETIYSTFFNWCCFPYVHFCELYLSCVYCPLMYICCILCVFVVSYVYLLYLMCICCTLCVFVVLCVYCCFYFRCQTAG
jgi:hypothetical protein